ncbi:hypothetical protein AB0B88_20910 [Micromonospora haikouensis]|uniref:hypothetical protein n=1 Tax=Micromonospora haikouensis TaxID=686309 RepID=UPI0033D22337
MDIDWLTWGPTGVAAVAAGIAVWQAVSAGRQAKSAQEQAASAKESAATAERQALAAEEQLALARQQYQSEQRARDEAEGPRFQVDQGVDQVNGERFAEIPIKLLAGTHLDTVIISAAGQPDVRGFVRRVGGDEANARPSITLTNLAPGATHTVVLELEWNASSPVNVRLDFECHEGAGGTRTWNRSYSSLLVDPPQPRSIVRRVRR